MSTQRPILPHGGRQWSIEQLRELAARVNAFRPARREAYDEPEDREPFTDWPNGQGE